MKTNVSIKFNSIEEYREIEDVIIKMGFKPRLDPFWYRVFSFSERYVSLMYKHLVFDVYSYTNENEKVYNSLQEFLSEISN